MSKIALIIGWVQVTAFMKMCVVTFLDVGVKSRAVTCTAL